MPLLTIPFDPNIGPLLVVGAASPLSLLPQNAPAPQMQWIKLLVDTGASNTSVSPAIAAQLALPILGKTTLRSVTHQVQANEYLGDLFIPIVNPPFPLRDLRLLEFPLGNPNFDGLLGRDLLQYGLLTLNGPARTMTLAF